MYKVKYTERFEDWYVAKGDVFHYETIQSACRGFEQVTRGLLSNSESIEGPRLYIEDGGHHAQKGFGGGHALHARQPLGQAHLGRNH